MRAAPPPPRVRACVQVRWIMVHDSGFKPHRYKCCNYNADKTRLLPVLGEFGSEGAKAYARCEAGGTPYDAAAAAAAEACAVQVHVALSPEMACEGSVGRDVAPCKHCARFYC